MADLVVRVGGGDASRVDKAEAADGVEEAVALMSPASHGGPPAAGGSAVEASTTDPQSSTGRAPARRPALVSPTRVDLDRLKEYVSRHLVRASLKRVPLAPGDLPPCVASPAPPADGPVAAAGDEEDQGAASAGATRTMAICNYSDSVQNNPALWDDLTSLTRALVVDWDSGEILARSFPKFFNYGELDAASKAALLGSAAGPAEGGAEHPPFEVYDKLDGSLVLVFHAYGQWHVASRGSFASGQAAEAEAILRDRYPLWDFARLDQGVAYTFEVIYPQNRIVVDYGRVRAMHLLAAFMRDGEEVTDAARELMGTLGVPCVRRRAELEGRDVRALAAINAPNEEGFVLVFRDVEVKGQRHAVFRAKVKFEDYIRFHRAKSNLTPARVFEVFAVGRTTVDEFAASFTEDELQRDAKTMWAAAEATYANAEEAARVALARAEEAVAASVPADDARAAQRAFALEVCNAEKAGTLGCAPMLVFLLRRGALGREVVCKNIREEALRRMEESLDVEQASVAV